MPKRLIPFKKKFAKFVATGALLTSLVSAPAAANPSGASVQSGQVNITGGAGSMTVQQFTDRAIIDWQKFGVGAGESLQFLQPGQLSVILNRVVGQDPTQILGQMSANGNVWIINPNGVLFGPNSQVNVGGLLASTLNISNEDFLNGNFRFTQDQNKALASVVNQGSITITDGGYAILMAPLVSNEGMIVANLGQVNLMSGESATLNFDGRNLISYDIGHLDSAEPGTVVVDRSTVSALLANVIQDPNLTEAGGIVENADGSVSLVGAAGTVLNSGSIQANGADGQQAGKVVLDSGRLTVLGEGSSVEASGVGADSDGGEILALSHGTLEFDAGAKLEAKGGEVSGDGGFIETSGYEHIILNGIADASAEDGHAGTWVIDPDFLTIVDGGGGSLDGTLDTSTSSNATDTISETYLESLTAGTNIILQANDTITINDLTDDLLDFQDDVSVTFLTNTGDIIFASGDDTVRVGGTGDITLDAGRDIQLGTVIHSGSGTVNLAFDGALVDLNGVAVTNLYGDNLNFDVTQSDLEFSDGSFVEIGGSSNTDPLRIDLNIGAGREVKLISDITKTLEFTGGTLSSSNFQSGTGTDINVVAEGDVELDNVRAADVSISTVGGNILQAGGSLSAVTSDSLELSATGGSIGASSSTVSVSTSNLSLQGDDGVFIFSTRDLETLRLTSDAASEADIVAANADLELSGNQLSGFLFDEFAGQAPGDSDGDGYDVTLDVTITGGDLTLGFVTLDGTTGTNDGAEGLAYLGIVNQGGDIEGSGSNLFVGDDTDLVLRSETGSVGSAFTPIQIQTANNSAGELVLDAVDGINVQGSGGQFDSVTIAHDDGTVAVSSLGVTIQSGFGIFTGSSNVSTIDYTNRTGGIDIGTVTTGGSDITLTAAGDILGTVNGVDDIIAGNNTVTVNAGGDFSADASTVASGSLEIGTVNGDVTLRNGDILNLNKTGAGQIHGDLYLDNNDTVSLGGDDFIALTVLGDVTITNSGSFSDDSEGQPGLVADNLTVTSDGPDTSFFLTARISDTMTLNDLAADGGGDADLLAVLTDLAFNQLNINSDSTDIVGVSTDGFDGDEVLFLEDGELTSSGPRIDVITINESVENVTGSGQFTESTDVTINASNGSLLLSNISVTGGVDSLAEHNLTLMARDDIGVASMVEDTLTIISQTGSISFQDLQTDGPNNIVVSTGAGRSVSGFWDGAESSMTYEESTDRLLITDTGAADTNVTFQTDTDSIDVDFAGVGDCQAGDLNSLTLIASNGAISDEGDPGTTSAADVATENGAAADPDLDLQGHTITLIAQDDIGGSPTGDGVGAGGALEVDACDTLSATSTQGSVSTSASGELEHVIIDVNQQDFDITFSEYVTGNTVNITYDGSATGSLSENTNSGSFQGTNLTLIERGNRDVQVVTALDNTGGGDPGSDEEFVSLTSGGGLTVNTGSTITSQNIDLDAENGTLDIQANLTAENDIFLEASGDVNLTATITAGDEVGVLSEGGDILGVGGFVEADKLALSAASNIGVDSVGDASALEFDASELAAYAGGDINLHSSNVNTLTVGESIALGDGTSISGITGDGSLDLATDGTLVVDAAIDMGENVCIDVAAGTLEIQDDITAEDDLFLEVDSDVVVSASVTGGSNDSVGITSETGSILSEGGDIDANNLALSAALDIGGSLSDPTTALEYAASKLAASAGNNIILNTPNSTQILFSLPLKSGSLEGIAAGGDLEITTGGALDIIRDVRAAGNIDLDIGSFLIVSGELESTDGNDISIRTDGALAFVRSIISNGGTISIEADGTVTGNTNQNVDLDAGSGLVVIQATRTISRMDITASQLAAESTNGSVSIDVFNSDLEIVEATTLETGALVTGLSANGSLSLNVADGSLDIGKTVQAGQNLSLEASDDVTVGASVTGGSTHTLDITSDTGNIVDAGGTITGYDVGLSAGGDIGMDSLGATLPLTLDVLNSVSSSSGGNTALNIVTTTPVSIAGISTGGFLELTTAGDLNVDENIVTGTDLALCADGDIQLGDDSGTTRGVLVAGVGADGAVGGGDDVTATVSLESGGEITDGNGDDTNDGDGDGFADGVNIVALGNGTTESGGNVVLKAGGSVGTDGGSGPIELDTLVVAASAGSGGLNLSEQDLLTDDGLTIGELSTLKGASVVTGVSASDDICIDVEDGALDIGSTIRANDNLLLQASGDVILGASVIGGASTSDFVGITSINGDIIDAGGSIDARNLALSAGNDIGVDAAGASSSIDFDAGSFAASAGGDINLNETGLGGVIVSSALPLKSGTISGIAGGGDLDLVTASSLAVTSAISMTGEISLEVGHHLSLFDPIESTGGSDIAIRTQGDIALSFNSDDAIVSHGGTISIEAGDAIVDRNGSGLDLDAGDGLIVIRSGGEIQGLEIAASQLALRAGAGDVLINDIDTTDLEIVEATTLLGGVVVTGVSTPGTTVGIDVADGSLNIQEDVASSRDITLTASQDVVVGAKVDGGFGAGDEVRITAQNGDIVNDGGSVEALTVVLSADGDIGVDTLGAASALDFTSNFLTAIAGNDINLSGTISFSTAPSGIGDGIQGGGDLTLYSDGRVFVDEAIRMGGDVCIDVDDILDLREDIESTGGGDIAIRATDDVLLGGDGDAVLSNGGTISVETGGSIQDRNGDSMDLDSDGGLVVLDADGGIGGTSAGEEIEIGAARLAASAGAGDVAIRDIDSDGLSVTEATTLKGGVVVTGVSASDDICLDVSGGQISVGQKVEAGGDLFLEADNIFINADIIGGTDSSDQVGITARTGDISQAENGAVSGYSVALSADRHIGIDGGFGDSVLGIDATNVAAEAGGFLRMEKLGGGDLTIAENLNLKSGTVSGLSAGEELELTTDEGLNVEARVQAADDICLDVGGTLTLSEDVESTGGSDIAIRTSDDVLLGDGSDDVVLSNGGTISVEAGGSIVDRNGDSMDLDSDGGLVVLDADGGIGGTAAGEEIEIGAARLAASAAGGDVAISDIDTGSLEIVEATTLKGGAVVTGVSASDDICLDVSDGRIGVGQVVQAGGDIFLEAEDIFINADILGGTDSTDQVGITARTGDISQTENGDIRGYSVALSAGGDIGVDGGFGDSVLGIDATNVAAEAGGFIRMEKLGGQELTVAENLNLKSGTVSGLTAGEELELTTDEGLNVEARVQAVDEISLDVGGTLTLSEDVESTGGGDIAIRTSDDVLLGDGNDDAVLSNGGTISVEAGGSLVDRNGDNVDLSSDGGLVVLHADGGIGDTDTGEEIEIETTGLAASAVNGDVAVSHNNPGGLTIAEATTLQGGVVVTGVSAGQDIGIEVETNDLRIEEDIVSGTAGEASEIALKVDGDIIIGDGAADGDQVRNGTTDTSNRVSLFSTNGDITDNNGDGVAAVDANGGEVVVSASNGTIGTTDFAGTSTAFEIDANRLAATSGDDVNIIDRDTNGDGLTISTLALANGDGSVTGVTASNDICIDVVNGAINVDQVVSATNGSIALRTQDSDDDDDADIVLNGADVTASAADQTVSLNSANQITDTDNTAGSVIADNVVMLADTGIGNTSEINLDTSHIAAQSISSGNVNLSDGALSNTKAGFTFAELSTLKTNTLVSGITSAADICLDLTDDLLVDEKIVSSGNLAIHTGGNIQLGDTTGATRGVLVAGVGADGAVGGGDDLTATISLEAGGDITDGNGDDTADNDGDGLADGANIIALGGGTVVMTADGGIGGTAAGEEIEIGAARLAASAAGGDVAVKDIDSDGLSITEATTLKGGVVVTGVSASDDISIEVENGNLGVGRNIQSGGDIFLEAENVYLNAELIGGTEDTDQIGITARTGDIGQTNNAGIRGNSVALSAGDDIGLDVGFGVTVLGIDASEVAAEAGGFIRIEKLGGGDLTVAENLNLKSGTVSGLTAGEELELTTDEGLNVEARVQAADEISLDVGGTLTLSEDVESTGGSDIAIRTGGDVLLGDGSDDAVLSNGGTISIETGGSIQDRNGDGTDLDSDGGLVVLDADGGIGGTVAGEEIEIGAARLAASAAGGDVAVTDIDSGSLEIVEAATLKGGVVVSGVSASDDICLDVSDGRIGVGQVVEAGGDIFLEAEDIFINADILGGTDSTDQVGITARTGDISQTENGDIRGYSVALSAGDDIGVDGGFGDSVLGIDASEVAAEAGGFIHIEKLGGGDLTVAENLNLKSGTVSGLTAGEELELTTDEGLNVEARVQAADEISLDVGGTLTLSENVESTGGADIAIRTGDDVLLGDGIDDAVLSNGGTISVEAGGSLTDRNGDNMDLDSDGGIVVLSAGGGIGEAASGQEIEIAASQLAASADGDVAVRDLDADGLEIVQVTTLLGGADINGINAAGSVRVEVAAGTLTVREDVAGGADVALRTQNGDITLNDESVIAATGRLSLDVGGRMVDNNDQTDGGASLVTQKELVINSLGSVGEMTTPLQIEASSLAAASTDGDIHVADLSGDLQVAESTTIIGGVEVNGLTAAGDICLEVLDGGLDIARQVKSENVALRATGSVDLSGTEDVAANRSTGTVSVEAGQEIAASSSATFIGRDVVLKSGSGVGNNETVNVEADNFAVDGGTGNADVRDIAGGATLSQITTAKGGDTVTGVTAAQDVSLETVGGDLFVDEEVSGGNVVFLKAEGDIHSNAGTTGSGKVSVVAGGNIFDGLEGEEANFQASDLVLKAGGNVGSSNEDLNIDSDRVAATGANIYLDEVQGDMVLSELTLEDETVTGVAASEEVLLQADDGTIETGLGVRAASRVTLRTRDSLVIEAPISTNAGGKVSIEVTQGGIEDANAGTDIQTGTAVLKASQDIGTPSNPIDTSVDMLSVQSENGSVNIVETDGLKLKPGALTNGGAVEGGRAGQDFNLTVENGDLEIAKITAGNNVNLSVPNGDVVDCNGDDSNIDAGGDVDISAPNGYVGVNQDQLEISAGGKVTIVQTDMGRDDADPIILPPGVFAQNNVKLGESSFYLDVLYGWQTTDELILIAEELEQSNY